MKIGLEASALFTHYQASSNTLTMCWKVTRTDGVILGFTALDRDLRVDGVSYEASSGFSPSATQSQSRLAVDNTELMALLDSENITVEALMAGLWDFAQVEIFLVNWRDIDAGTDLLVKGRLGQVSIDRGTYTAELRGLAAAYTPPKGELYQITCRAQLGDSRCGVDLEYGVSLDTDAFPFRGEGVIEAVSDNGLVLTDSTRIEPGPAGGVAITNITQANPPVVTSAAHGFEVGQIVYLAAVSGMVELNGFFYVVKTVPTVNSYTLGVDATEYGAYTSGGTATPQGDQGFWDYGTMTMIDGPSAGLSMEVKAYSEGLITLQLEFPLGVEAGNAYTIQVGCGKRFAEDCVSRFDNAINFRGEPHIPGIDQVLRVGGQ